MLIFEKVADYQNWRAVHRAARRSVGFAPTMGALHEGHLELIRMAKTECDLAVASIFVNPTQFNDPKDLEKYPRTPEADTALLRDCGCDAVFMPPVGEVYPPGLDLNVDLDFGALDKVMEGRFRPGHFAGMATVVNRLLDIVQPDTLFMGQKDYQQLSIVRDMLRQLNSDIRLVMCPTVREPDGLAMSSRNRRLDPALRAAAPVIYEALLAAKRGLPQQPARKVEQNALEKIAAAGLRPEYFEIVDGMTLLPVERYGDSDFIVACTAAFAGTVRLVDNMPLKG